MGGDWWKCGVWCVVVVIWAAVRWHKRVRGKNAETEPPGLSWARRWKPLRGAMEGVGTLGLMWWIWWFVAVLWCKRVRRFGVEMWVNGRVWVVFDHLGP